jgi:hypothetical protein
MARREDLCLLQIGQVETYLRTVNATDPLARPSGSVRWQEGLGSVLAGLPGMQGVECGQAKKWMQSGRGLDRFEQWPEESKRLIRHYQPLAQFWCQLWCQVRAIFPVFTDFTGFFAFCRR